MLATLAEFPNPGSIAWTRPTPHDEAAHKVRILENDGRRDPLIAYTGIPPRDPALRRLGAFAMPASGNTRLPLATLTATRDEALSPVRPPRASPRRPEVNARDARPVRQPNYAKLGIDDPEGRN